MKRFLLISLTMILVACGGDDTLLPATGGGAKGEGGGEYAQAYGPAGEFPLTLQMDGVESLFFQCPPNKICGVDMSFGFDTFIPAMPSAEEAQLESLGIRVDRDYLSPAGERKKTTTVVPLARTVSAFERLGTLEFGNGAEVKLSIDNPWKLLLKQEFSGLEINVTIPLCAGRLCR